MRTRIILHGGNSNKKSDKNDRFFREVIGGIDKDAISVLCVYFARPEGRWEDSYAEDQSIFRALGIETGKDIETRLATYDMDALLAGIAEADVIFINGGYKGHLRVTLGLIGIDNFRRRVKGKTLVGISAGANVLGRYYYSQGIDGIREGVGFLGAKVLTHYSAAKPEQLELLTAYGEELPVVMIAEEEYTVIE